jgi:hypothetical protein
MAGLSLFLLPLLAAPLAASPQDIDESAPQGPEVTVPQHLPGEIDLDLSFKDLVERTYDPRWMLQKVAEGEKVETFAWAVDETGHASVQIDGQGAVARIWLAQASGRIRIYADGAEQPSLDWDLDQLLAKRLPAHLNSPLFSQVGSGFVCRIPLPFNNSMRIDFDTAAASGQEGTLTVRRFGKDVTLEPLVAGTLEANLRPLRFAAQTLRDNSNPETVGETPLSWAGTFRNHAPPTDEGADYYYGDLRVPIIGNGVLRWFEIEFHEKLPPQQMAQVLRGITLRMELNTVKSTIIGDIIFEAPLGDFLGSAPGLNEFQTHLIGYNEKTGVFYFRMPVPFTGGLKVSLSSDLPEPITVKTRWGVNKYATAEDVPPLRLHSGWARGSFQGKPSTPATPSQPGVPTAALLNIPSEARLLGYSFSSTASSVQPQIFKGPFSFVNSWISKAPLAFEQVTLRQGPGGFGNRSAIRLFGLEAPTSHQQLEFDPGILLSANGETHYSAVAWWYAPFGSTSSFPTDAPLEERWPLVEPTPSFHLVAGAYECESLDGALMASGTTAFVVQAADLSSKWSRLQFLDWRPTAANQVLNFPFPVEEAGRYELYAQFAKGTDYGKVQVLVDGRRLGDPLDFSGTELTPSGEIQVGSLRLMKRLDHKIAFMSLDGKAVGVDYFRLQPLSKTSTSNKR